MSFNFPASPAIGQLYPTPAIPGLPQYVFDGNAWNGGAVGSAVRYDAQSLTAPQQTQARTNIDAAQATVFDTAWKALPYVNGWADYGLPYSPCGYRKLSSGLVVLRGLVQGGTATQILTLPVGYRPGIQLLLGVQTSPNVMCRLDIQTNGSLYHTGGAAGWISLGGICFLAEN